MSKPKTWRGKLLASGQDSKTIKGDKEGYATAIMYMKPFKTDGVNICAMAELAGCHAPCLNLSGMGVFSNVQLSRLKKTQFWIRDREGFLKTLHNDINNFRKWAHKQGKTPVIRLNGTSDIRWENYGVPQAHPDLTFYDYTKESNRRNLPSNYTLTWSYSEANQKYTDMAPAGENWAVVFRSSKLPKFFKGRKVVDGDKNDLRFLDDKNVIVGLYAKGKAKKDTSGFVIDA